MGRPKKIGNGTSIIKDKLLQLEKEKNDYLNNIEAKENSIKKSYKADLDKRIKQKKVELKDLEKEYDNLYGKKGTSKTKTTKIQKAIRRGRPKKDLVNKKEEAEKEKIKSIEKTETKKTINEKAPKVKNKKVILTTEKSETIEKGKK
jgi:hypothetical protein